MKIIFYRALKLLNIKTRIPQDFIKSQKLEIENPNTLRKQEILFAITKKLAQKRNKPKKINLNQKKFFGRLDFR